MTKKVDGLRFTKLRTIPGKLYTDVQAVRTKDNAVITVRLMLFYRLINIEQMLDTSNDPIGEFASAATADAIEWCAPKQFDEFLASTESLNTLAPYKQLQASAAKMGYELDKVVFRGYQAPKSLQNMHDSALARRTEQAMIGETEEAEQRLTDFKLARKSERAARQTQLEMARLNAEIAIQQRREEADQQIERESKAIELDRFIALKDLDRNFDVGQYLEVRDNKTSRVIRCGDLRISSVAQMEMDVTADERENQMINCSCMY